MALFALIQLILILLINLQLQDSAASAPNNTSSTTPQPSKSPSRTWSPPKNISIGSPGLKRVDRASLSVKREGKFLPGFAFFNGLSLGSLASALALAGGPLPPAPPPSNPSTRVVQLPPLSDALAHSSFPGRVSAPNVYDPGNPYSTALSTSILLSQSLRSLAEMIRQLKTRAEPSEARPTFSHPATSNEIEGDESQIRVLKPNREEAPLNVSALVEIIRDTIKQEQENFIQRQALPFFMSFRPDVKAQNNGEAEDAETQMADDPTTTTTTITTTTTTTPPPTTTKAPKTEAPATYPPVQPPHAAPPSYFGGHPHQNLSGVDLTAPSYPSTSYGYPHGGHQAYGPPAQEYPVIYGPPASYRPANVHPEFYQSEPYSDFSSDHSAAHHFPSNDDNFPIYPPYARVSKSVPPLIHNGFIPSGQRKPK